MLFVRKIRLKKVKDDRNLVHNELKKFKKRYPDKNIREYDAIDHVKKELVIYFICAYTKPKQCDIGDLLILPKNSYHVDCKEIEVPLSRNHVRVDDPILATIDYMVFRRKPIYLCLMGVEINLLDEYWERIN